MRSEGLVGEIPAWYGVLQVARWAGVSPLEVLAWPLMWYERALTAMDAEREARAAG